MSHFLAVMLSLPSKLSWCHLPSNCSGGRYFCFLSLWGSSFSTRHPSPSFRPSTNPPSQMQCLLSRNPLVSQNTPSSNLPLYVVEVSLKAILPLPWASRFWNCPSYLKALFSMLPSTIPPSFHVPLQVALLSSSRNCPFPLAFPLSKAPLYIPFSEKRMPSLWGSIWELTSMSSPSQQVLLVITAQSLVPRLAMQQPFLCSLHPNTPSFSCFEKISCPNSMIERASPSAMASLMTEKGTLMKSSSMWRGWSAGD